MIKIQELFRIATDPKAKKEYQKWLELPMTQEVIADLEELNRPVLPLGANELVLAVCHASQCSFHNTLRQMTHLDELGETQQEVAETYGTEGFMTDVTQPKGKK